MASLERKADDGFNRVEQKLDTTFRWVIGVIPANWITLMLAVFLHR